MTGPRPQHPMPTDPPRENREFDLVLVGATGFVGAHLLHQLLTRTDARVICPVRAKDEAQAMERLRSADRVADGSAGRSR